MGAAKRKIKDSQISEVSNENRFDASCKAIIQMVNEWVHREHPELFE